jgi:hypothetical protein
MTTHHNTMEGRRTTAMANDPEYVRRFGGTGDYVKSFEQDTENGTAEVLHLDHRLSEAGARRATIGSRRHAWGFPGRWAWAAYAVWPKDEPGVPGIYEWLAGAWLVEGQPYPTQRAAVTAALALARSRRDQV